MPQGVWMAAVHTADVAANTRCGADPAAAVDMVDQVPAPRPGATARLDHNQSSFGGTAPAGQTCPAAIAQTGKSLSRM